jgi:hypothetical protein
MGRISSSTSGALAVVSGKFFLKRTFEPGNNEKDRKKQVHQRENLGVYIQYRYVFL